MMAARPETIDYTCKRCLLAAPSAPLPSDPKALAIYGLPDGWELGSCLAPFLLLAVSDDDFCLCESCVTDIRKGAPLDLRDLGSL